ncbi:MAG: site-2 protease family protein [Patescibacteria group bacterium]
MSLNLGTSLKLGKILGVDVDLHWSVLVIVYLVINGVVNSYIPMRHPDISIVASIAMSVFMSVLFLASILAHELAHSTVGRKYGIGFMGITLFALGGVAKMNPYKPIPSAKAEFWMALAGPAMSFAIGIACGIFCLLGNVFVPIFYFIIPEQYLLMLVGIYAYCVTIAFYTGVINIVLGAFNLFILGYPLDGGRVLRSTIWAISKNYKLATLWSANIGRVFAVLFAFTGVLMAIGYTVPFFGTGVAGGTWLFIIAFLLFAAATSELKHLKET